MKFFGKIRRKLVAEKRFRNYLPYALGEIVLVVVGILIALQINNWNEAKKQDKLEYQALQNLKVDFELNTKRLEEIIQTSDQNIDKSNEILSHTGNKNSGHFQLDSLILAAVSGPSFSAQNGFLNDLINSGNLGVLQNVELRSKLSSWDPALDDLKRREMYLEEAESKLIEFINQNGNWLNVDNYNFANSESNIEIPDSGFDVSNNEMLSSIVFENLVENSVVYHRGTMRRQKQCLELSREILELIVVEIKRFE